MLFSLVKKDYILSKKYLLLLIAVAAGAPIFLTYRTKIYGIGILSFLMTALMIEYLLNGTVSMADDKYKGSALLCATPYTRSTIVESEYVFLLINFIVCCIMYIIPSYAVSYMEKLSMRDFGLSLLIICTFFGIAIPLEYKFGFEKVKYIFTFIIFIGPFLAPSAVKFAVENNINLNVLSELSYAVQNIILYGLSAVIIYVSMVSSSYIYSNKNL